MSFKIQSHVLVLTLLGMSAFSLASGLSPRETRFWTQLYQDLNPGRDVHHPDGRDVDWPRGGPRAWARVEQSRLEPMVAAILRGERDDIPWNYALSFAATMMPTQGICDEVYARMESMYLEKIAKREDLNERDHGLLSSMVSVLAAGNDGRAVTAINELIQRDDYDFQIGRTYLMAIRAVGDRQSVAAIRAMSLRKKNEKIDREAALSERIIASRLSGEKFSLVAQEELRELVRGVLLSMETNNREKFATCLAKEVRSGIDEKRFEEFRQDQDIARLMPALRSAVDRQLLFDVDENELMARLHLDQGWVFEVAYEIDGWKMINIRRLETTQSHP